MKYFNEDLFKPGRVLELGCGPGRNAIYFAELGCRVDAIDLSQKSLQWAKERAAEKGININFINQNIFDLDIPADEYDIVYDSGCFHHIAPHRRMSYLPLVKKALKPNGYFALTCFKEGENFGGAVLTDWDVYRKMSLRGGLGYTEEKLREVFKDFTEIEGRSMRDVKQPTLMFGSDGLLTALFQNC